MYTVCMDSQKQKTQWGDQSFNKTLPHPSPRKNKNMNINKQKNTKKKPQKKVIDYTLPCVCSGVGHTKIVSFACHATWVGRGHILKNGREGSLGQIWSPKSCENPKLKGEQKAFVLTTFSVLCYMTEEGTGNGAYFLHAWPSSQLFQAFLIATSPTKLN